MHEVFSRMVPLNCHLYQQVMLRMTKVNRLHSDVMFSKGGKFLFSVEFSMVPAI